MISFAVTRRQHIEEERFDVIIQSLVIQKELRKQAEVLAVNLVSISIDFENRDFPAAIDFSARWIAPCALVQMSLKYEFAFGVLQAELAEKQFW